MIKTIDGTTTEYRTPEGKLHNPHRYALRYTDNEIVYYIKGKEHNIVGPSRIHPDEEMDFAINGRLI